ncbi:hypothetical protein IEQ34_001860 [Dendrobium chrysotoxum]|uniref:Uncharacterized protein n=1 Tax=Dendrobium chrysotoxum TaxID=161865 RepID=A0AAV7HKJ5_DENCH|nr:hypothetical protein IEQ34_001860 [Dendrobium chrysotoxum]
MRFRSFFGISQVKALSSRFRRLYSHLRPQGRRFSLSDPELLRFISITAICFRCWIHLLTICRPSFGIAFDIDGVIIRGGNPIGGSPQALSRLHAEDGREGFLKSYACLNSFPNEWRLDFLTKQHKSIGYKTYQPHFSFYTGILKIPYIFLTNGEHYIASF